MERWTLFREWIVRKRDEIVVTSLIDKAADTERAQRQILFHFTIMITWMGKECSTRLTGRMSMASLKHFPSLLSLFQLNLRVFYFYDPQLPADMLGTHNARRRRD